MIEWNLKRPKNRDKRIVKKFALFPVECHSDVKIWLEYYFVFQEYEEYEPNFLTLNAGYYSYDYKTRYSRWTTVNIFSQSQFANFKQNLALHLTDTNLRLRMFAEVVQRELIKK